METILCSAIWFGQLTTSVSNPVNIHIGVVISGYRHHHCIHALNALTGKRLADVGEYEQGFLTSTNRFVDRTEAAQIALDAKQISELKFSQTMLYSEDLY